MVLCSLWYPKYTPPSSSLHPHSCPLLEIAYIAYSTLGGQWAYRPSSSSSPNPVSTDATLGTIATAHDTSRQAVALSWALQSGALVLPRSSHSSRIRENLRIFKNSESCSSSPHPPGDNGDEWSVAEARENNGVKAILEAGGGSVGQKTEGRRAADWGDSGVRVFLSDEDMSAVGLLDGSIGS